MARTCSISEKDLRRAHKIAANVQEMCNLLGVSNVTVYKYLERYKLLPPNDGKLKIYQSVFNAYRGRKSMEDVATELDMPVGSVRHYLSRAIRQHWADKKPDLPMPSRLRLIKVIHEIEAMPSIAKFPARIARATGIRESAIVEYLGQRKVK